MNTNPATTIPTHLLVWLIMFLCIACFPVFCPHLKYKNVRDKSHGSPSFHSLPNTSCTQKVLSKCCLSKSRHPCDAISSSANSGEALNKYRPLCMRDSTHKDTSARIPCSRCDTLKQNKQKKLGRLCLQGNCGFVSQKTLLPNFCRGSSGLSNSLPPEPRLCISHHIASELPLPLWLDAGLTGLGL